MTEKFRKWAAPVSATLAAGLPFMAFAQEDLPEGPTSLDEFEGLFCTVAQWLFTFFILLAIIFIIIAAYKYLTAQGDPEKVKGASNSLIYAIVAIVVAVLARGVPLIVSSLVDTNINVNC